MSTKKNPTSSPEAWETRPERRIAVVGFTETKHEAPWSDDAWECWGMNNLHMSLPEETWKRASHWYNLHDVAIIEQDQPHVDWLRAGHMPVYVWEAKEEWPTSVEFPKANMIERFGRYFTNSVSWMLAHAIYEGATEIGVYGVDMAQSSEYSSQRPSCEYFLGLAAGLGIAITIPQTSDLLKSASLYGAESDGGLALKLDARSSELRVRLQDMENQHGQIMAGIHQLRGALESNDYIRGVWMQPSVTDRSTSAADPNLP